MESRSRWKMTTIKTPIAAIAEVQGGVSGEA